MTGQREPERKECIVCNPDYGICHYWKVGVREQCENCELTMKLFDEYKKFNKWFTDYENRDYCDDNCRGWDGEWDRCECGNRRIRWDVYYEDGILVFDYYAW
mgnify:CR=1 FL=1